MIKLKALLIILYSGNLTAYAAVVYNSKAEWIAAVEFPETIRNVGGFTMTPTGVPEVMPYFNGFSNTPIYATNYFHFIAAQNSRGTGADIGLYNVGITMAQNPRLFYAFAINVEAMSGPWTIGIGGESYPVTTGFTGWIAEEQMLGGAFARPFGGQQFITITVPIDSTPSSSISLNEISYALVPEPSAILLLISGSIFGLLRRVRVSRC